MVSKVMMGGGNDGASSDEEEEEDGENGIDPADERAKVGESGRVGSCKNHRKEIRYKHIFCLHESPFHWTHHPVHDNSRTLPRYRVAHTLLHLCPCHSCKV